MSDYDQELESTYIPNHVLSHPFCEPLKTIGRREYSFVFHLLHLKYTSDYGWYETNIVGGESSSGTTKEKDLRFEFIIKDTVGSEHIGRSPTECEDLIQSLQEKWPKSNLLIRAWHWNEFIVLPMKNGDFVNGDAVGIRDRHLDYLANTLQSVRRNRRSSILHQHLLGGILDAIVHAGIDFSSCETENDIQNVLLKALGRQTVVNPNPLAHQVVFEFRDGTITLWRDALAEKHIEEKIEHDFQKECSRRRRKRMSLDGFIRTRRPEDDVINDEPVLSNTQLRRFAKQSLDSSML